MANGLTQKRPAEVVAPTATGGTTVLAIWLFGMLFPDVKLDAETAGAITLVITLLTGPVWARIKGWLGWGTLTSLLLCGALLAGMTTGCITTTTTLPDGTVTVTQRIDLEALAALPGTFGAIGDEIIRIDNALDDVDESAPPTPEEIALRQRREELVARLLELGFELIEDSLSGDANV